LQDLQAREDKVHEVVVDLKKGKKTMSLPEKINIDANINILQAKEKVVQAQKFARQAQLEPLQEKAEQLVMEVDAAKSGVEQIGFDGGDILNPPVTMEMVESMVEKRN